MTKKPPPPPPPKRGESSARSPRATIHEAVAIDFNSGAAPAAHRILIYGPSGIGKTTVAAYLPGCVFFDLELGSRMLPVSRDDTIDEWGALRGKAAYLAANKIPEIQSLIIDTGTVAEELAKEFVIANRTTEKGNSVDSIEGFGWGKGWQYVYEEFTGLLADLDRVVAAGVNVCVVAHEVSSPVPNPAGEDFIRWEPHFYAGDKKQRGSIRNRVIQWADHVLFVSHDIRVREGTGKAIAGGSRTIYTVGGGTHVASTRARAKDLVDFTLQDPAAIWRELGIIPDTTPKPQ